MQWQVRYKRQSLVCVDRYATQKIALKAACLLIDQGFDVLTIGLGELDFEHITGLQSGWTPERQNVAATEAGG